MGLAAGDFDRDGDDDLFISHWIAQGFALYQSLTVENRTAGKAPGLRFTDVAEISGVGQSSLQKIGWGAAFADFDADGWLDLAVANGSTFESKDSTRRLLPMEAFLFWNDRNRFFQDLAPWNRSLSTARVSRGLAIADYNNDGAMDLALVDLDGGVRLLRNDVPHGNWAEFRLKSGAGRSADGALVLAKVGKRTSRAMVTSASYLSQNTRRVHFGLGGASRIDRLEVRWPGRKAQVWENVEANRIWDLVENEEQLVAFAAGDAPAAIPEAQPLTREQQVEFWARQRAAMDAMKRENDLGKAARLFHEALALNPAHEDSRYYLANCLVAAGDREGAIAELETLARLSPMSHRAWQRRGVLLAAIGRYDRAAESFEKALSINPEETGTLLLLAEVAIARADLPGAAKRLKLALQMNPRSVGGLYLSGYVAWRGGEQGRAVECLNLAQKARGPDWKPKGSAAEGDVKRRMGAEAGFLADYWEDWNGTADPAAAYRAMDRQLNRRYAASVR
jgi:tetratricopeptide (TPR) repeat protein